MNNEVSLDRNALTNRNVKADFVYPKKNTLDMAVYICTALSLPPEVVLFVYTKCSYLIVSSRTIQKGEMQIMRKCINRPTKFSTSKKKLCI
jgi:hypothetical protein